jgi:hypothetical protein
MIHCAVKAKRDPTLFNGNSVGNHRVARRTANTLSNSIREPDCENLMPVCDEGEQRARDGCHRIAGHNEDLSLA